MRYFDTYEELQERVIELETEAKGWEEIQRLLQEEDVYTSEDLKNYIEEHSELKDKVEELDFKLSSLR